MSGLILGYRKTKREPKAAAKVVAEPVVENIDVSARKEEVLKEEAPEPVELIVLEEPAILAVQSEP